MSDQVKPGRVYREFPSRPLGEIMGVPKKVRIYPEGRMCAEEGCTTPLNVHNKGPRCLLHKREAERKAAMNAPPYKKCKKAATQ